MNYRIVNFQSKEEIGRVSNTDLLPRSGEYLQWHAKQYKVVSIFHILDVNAVTVFVQAH